MDLGFWIWISGARTRPSTGIALDATLAPRAVSRYPAQAMTEPATPFTGPLSPSPTAPTSVTDTPALVPPTEYGVPNTLPATHPPSSSRGTLAGTEPERMASGVPKRLGHYLLLEEIGRGGMGIVYRARHERLGTQFAVKTLLAGELASPDAIERFQREAAAVARMGKHPNIVTVHDLGQEGSVYYFSMEYVEGASLRHVLRERPMQPAEGSALLEKVARAIHFAHERGIIHRDIKPDNILVRDSDGEPQVSDFGLARDVQSDSKISITGQILGTPSYMSPEQIEGIPDLIDTRTDVFALGCVLYEILTGKMAHEGQGVMQILDRVLDGIVVPPRTIRPQVPLDLQTICQKAMSLEPDRRYQTAEALAEDLARFRRGEPLLARPDGVLRRWIRRAKRNRAAAAAAGVALAMALVAIGVAAWFTVKPRLDAARVAREEAEARDARRDASNRLALHAREAVARGDLDDADRAARELVESYTAWAARGEDVPVSEGHLALGLAARTRGRAREALVHFYHAFEAAVGTPREPDVLAHIGHQLFDMNERDQAMVLFRRVLGGEAPPKAAFLAKWGIARGLVAEFEPEEAFSALHAIEDDLEATPAQRDEIRLLKRLVGPACTTLVVPGVPDIAPRFDLDGDGLAEEMAFLSPSRFGVTVGRVRSASYEELSTSEAIGESDGYKFAGAIVANVDGDPQLEVIAAGGSEDQRGGVAVFEWRNGRIDAGAIGGPVAGRMMGPTLTVADLNGDGVNEIVVGDSVFDRAVRYFSYDAKARKVALIAVAPLNGDIFAVLASDLDEDGQNEVWAFGGAWGCFGITCMSLDPTKKQLLRRSYTPMAQQYHLESAPFARDHEVYARARWSEMAANSVRGQVGEEEFRRRYAIGGLYRIMFGRDMSVKFEPLLDASLAWPAGIGVVPKIVRGPGGEEWLWATADDEIAGETVAGTGARTRVFLREGRAFRPVTWITNTRWGVPQTQDWDGDGDDEFVRLVDGDLEIRGLSPPPAGLPVWSRAAPTAQGTRAPRRAVAPVLAAAREMEAVQLWAEAYEGYGRVLAAPQSQEDLVEAVLGAFRCGAADGKIDEAVAQARAVVTQYPLVMAEVGRALVDGLEEAGRWQDARAWADELAATPGVRSSEAEELRRRAEQLRGLAEPTPAVAMNSDAFRAADLLATSPFCARRGNDGSITIEAPATELEGVFLPLSYGYTSYRLRARLQVLRQDWTMGFSLGLFSGEIERHLVEDPAWLEASDERGRGRYRQFLQMRAFGETGSPTRAWDMWALSPSGGAGARVATGPPCPGPETSVTLEFARHQGKLRGTLEGAGVDPLPAELAVEGLEDARVFLALEARGKGSSPACQGALRLADFEIASAPGGVALAKYLPQRPIELLWLANGRWVQGRSQEALALYDQAVEAADLEAACAEAMKAKGLPTELEVAARGGDVRLVPVDARFWRGLAKAATAGAEAGTEDLREAGRRSAERVTALIRRAGVSASPHPGAVTALRLEAEALSGIQGAANAEGLAIWMQKAWEVDVANTLLRDLGKRLAPVSMVEGPPETGENAFQPGDVLVEVDGVAIGEPRSCDAVVAAAVKAGKPRVSVALRRGGRLVTAEFDPSAAGPRLVLAHELRDEEEGPTGER